MDNEILSSFGIEIIEAKKIISKFNDNFDKKLTIKELINKFELNTKEEKLIIAFCLGMTYEHRRIKELLR